ncbi:unnamed protein product [Auanema sp. JU1783]|nr:unnamed protein product [Auanema sp. JU1783]
MAAEPAEGKREWQRTPSNIPVGYIILCTLCMTSLYSTILSFHMTVNMVHSYGNGSESDFYNVSDYIRHQDGERNVTVRRHKFLSNPQKESLITVVPIGGILFYVPAALLYNHLGFRRTFVIMAAIGIIPDILLPAVTRAQTYVLAIMIRIIQGFALASFIPYVCKLSVFLPFQHMAIPSIAFAFIQLAGFFTFPLSAIMSWSSLGWHSVHYGSAIMTFCLVILCLISTSGESFKKKSSEMGFLRALFRYDRSRSKQISLQLPYLSIYQDVRVWSCLIAGLGYFTTIQLYLQWGPTFLNKVADLNIITTGLVSMVPPFVNLFVGFLVYIIFPQMANETTTKLRLFNSLGTVVPGIIYIIIGCLDAKNHYGVAATLYVVGSSFLGFCSCGFLHMLQLRSVQYHLFILINLFSVNLGSMFLCSLLNVLIAKNNEYTSWAVVFIVQGVILIVTNLIFCLFASDEKAHWAAEGFEDTSIQPRREDPLPQRPL